MSEEAWTALRRIASGMKLTEGGDFTRMPRAQMMAPRAAPEARVP